MRRISISFSFANFRLALVAVPSLPLRAAFEGTVIATRNGYADAEYLDNHIAELRAAHAAYEAEAEEQASEPKEDEAAPLSAENETLKAEIRRVALKYEQERATE